MGHIVSRIFYTIKVQGSTINEIDKIFGNISKLGKNLAPAKDICSGPSASLTGQIKR